MNKAVKKIKRMIKWCNSQTFLLSAILMVIIFVVFLPHILNMSSSLYLLTKSVSFQEIVSNRYILATVLGYLVTGIIADFVLKQYAHNLWLRSRDSFNNAKSETQSDKVLDWNDPVVFARHFKHFEWMARRVGVTERVLYTTAIISNQYALIGVWLVLKAIGKWDDNFSTKVSVGRVRANNFLIGNALSLIFGVLGGVLFKSIINPYFLQKLIGQ